MNGLPGSAAGPGRHNVENALAALAAAEAAGVPLAYAVEALAGFKGLRRRFELVGRANGVSVIDDFGHNPDKIAATLRTLHAFPGRLLVFFQPHGYAPLERWAASSSTCSRGNWRRTTCCSCPTRSIMAAPPTAASAAGRSSRASSPAAGEPSIWPTAAGARRHGSPVTLARPGDRIVVMGARDDTLTLFAQQLLERLR